MVQFGASYTDSGLGGTNSASNVNASNARWTDPYSAYYGSTDNYYRNLSYSQYPPAHFNPYWFQQASAAANAVAANNESAANKVFENAAASLVTGSSNWTPRINSNSSSSSSATSTSSAGSASSNIGSLAQSSACYPSLITNFNSTTLTAPSTSSSSSSSAASSAATTPQSGLVGGNSNNLDSSASIKPPFLNSAASSAAIDGKVTSPSSYSANNVHSLVNAYQNYSSNFGAIHHHPYYHHSVAGNSFNFSSSSYPPTPPKDINNNGSKSSGGETNSKSENMDANKAAVKLQDRSKSKEDKRIKLERDEYSSAENHQLKESSDQHSSNESQHQASHMSSFENSSINPSPTGKSFNSARELNGWNSSNLETDHDDGDDYEENDDECSHDEEDGEEDDQNNYVKMENHHHQFGNTNQQHLEEQQQCKWSPNSVNKNLLKKKPAPGNHDNRQLN